jgi:hypothetical protein
MLLIYKFYILHTQCVLVFCSELKTDRKYERISLHSNKWLGLQSILRDYGTVNQNLHISQCSLISKVGRAMTRAVIFR